MMLVGLDIGYGHTKAIRGTGDRFRVKFPSVVGTPEQSRFSFDGGDNIIFLQPGHVQVGNGAITQSYSIERREDRGWVNSDLWMYCFYGALTELTKAVSIPVKVIAGLPIAYYDDRETVVTRLMGEHRVVRQGRERQTFQVVDCRVVPQPYGTLLYEAMSLDGELTNERLINGRVGVIDIGSKNTNILYVKELAETRRHSTSVDVGAWDAVRNMKDFLDSEYPDLNLRDHEIADVIKDGYVPYYGTSVDLRGPIQDILMPFAHQISAKADEWWQGGAASLSAILITGGGAYLMGGAIKEYFKFATIVDDPVFANADGFLRFAYYLWGHSV